MSDCATRNKSKKEVENINPFHGFISCVFHVIMPPIIHLKKHVFYTDLKVYYYKNLKYYITLINLSCTSTSDTDLSETGADRGGGRGGRVVGQAPDLFSIGYFD